MEKTINVLHVIGQLNAFGGTPVKLLYQVTNSSQNFKFTMCCINDPAGGLVNKFEDAGIEVIKLKHKSNYDISHVFDIVRIIKEKKIDIVHTHFSRSNTYGRIAALISGRPMIMSEHGIIRNAPIHISFFDNLLNLCTSHLISNSYATMDSVKETIFLNRKNMAVIHNGVPDTFSDPPADSREDIKKEYGFSPDDFLVLNVGSHIFARNQITLIRAIANIHRDIPEIRVVLIGDGITHSSLEAEIKKLKLENHVFLWKRIAREKVHRVLHSADIFVNPAILEGFGIATVEAMLCRLPIICANSGSLPELISHDQEGLLYEPKNSEELSNCILRLYKSRELCKSLGESARTKALDRFSIKRFVHDFEQKYMSMIN